MGGHRLLYYTAVRWPLVKPFQFTSTLFSSPTKGYSKQGEKGSGPGVGERAPSTAEEFKRVAEEKARQGVVSQTVDKAEDAVKETVMGDSNPDNVKEKYKQPSEDITPKRSEEI